MFRLFIRQLNQTQTNTQMHTDIPRQITWTFKPPAPGSFQQLLLMSRTFSIYASVCVCVLEMTTDPFIKVLALHLPWGQDCMLPALVKTYICPFPFFPVFPPIPLSPLFLSLSLCACFSVSTISFRILFWQGLPLFSFPDLSFSLFDCSEQFRV